MATTARARNARIQSASFGRFWFRSTGFVRNRPTLADSDRSWSNLADALCRIPPTLWSNWTGSSARSKFGQHWPKFDRFRARVCRCCPHFGRFRADVCQIRPQFGPMRPNLTELGPILAQCGANYADHKFGQDRPNRPTLRTSSAKSRQMRPKSTMFFSGNRSNLRGFRSKSAIAASPCPP